MQNQKKTLWLTALAGALTIAFASGCPDDDKSAAANKDGGGPGGPGSGTSVQLQEWKQIKRAANFSPANDKVHHLAVSGDGKWVYASGGVELFAADLSGKFADIADDAKWAKINLAATGLVGNGGVADLTPAMDNIHRLVGASDGVLMSGKHSTAANTAGAALLVAGKTPKAAWVPLNGANTHIGINGINTGTALNAGVLKRKSGKEYPLIQYISGAFNVDQNRTIASPVDDAAVKATLGVNYIATGNFAGGDNNHFFATVGSGADTKAMVVTSRGVHVYADADSVGTGTAVAAATGEGVVGRWQVDTGAANNDAINAVAVSGDKLFIALNSNGADNKGGVAVYDAKAATSPANVNAAWKNIAVLGFAVDSTGKVLAVTKDGLFEAKADGAKGDPLKATALPATPADAQANKVYDKNENLLPTSNITDAKFVGDNLVISTDGNGLIVRLKAVPHKM